MKICLSFGSLKLNNVNGLCMVVRTICTVKGYKKCGDKVVAGLGVAWRWPLKRLGCRWFEGDAMMVIIGGGGDGRWRGVG